jgi:hypothetical protein
MGDPDVLLFRQTGAPINRSIRSSRGSEIRFWYFCTWVEVKTVLPIDIPIIAAETGGIAATRQKSAG